MLLPASTYIDNRELQFDNRTPRNISVVNTTVVAQGELTGYQLNKSAIAISPDSQSLPANQIVGINLVLNRSAMPPDHYTGSVYLNFDTRGNRLTLPLDLNIRTGPLFPILVLFLGVILGRLFQYVQGSGGAQADALKEVNRLDLDIADADLENEQDRKILTVMSNEARKLIFREKIDAAIAEIEAIRNRLEVLINLQLIEKQIGEDPLDTQSQKEALEQIEQIRFFIARQDDAAANESLEKLKTILNNQTSEASREMAMNISLQEAQAATKRILKISSESSSKPSLLKRSQRFMVVLSGLSDLVRVEATLWFVKPILSLTLLFALTAMGLNSLYIENGKTFGARPFSDFLGLLLWGLSADVACRSLNHLSTENNKNV
ncbi:hypothetical protein NUACC21_19920 [Scytonema sp. NUACC21]